MEIESGRQTRFDTQRKPYCVLFCIIMVAIAVFGILCFNTAISLVQITFQKDVSFFSMSPFPDCTLKKNFCSIYTKFLTTYFYIFLLSDNARSK